MELIDRDMLIDDMKKRYCKPCKTEKKDYNGVRCRACWIDDAILEIEDAPVIDIAKFKGKVADEPDEWVQGYLMKNDCIFQVKEHKGSKCCGFGMFQVDPETVVQVTEETENGGR